MILGLCCPQPGSQLDFALDLLCSTSTIDVLSLDHAVALQKTVAAIQSFASGLDLYALFDLNAAANKVNLATRHSF